MNIHTHRTHTHTYTHTHTQTHTHTHTCCIYLCYGPGDEEKKDKREGEKGQQATRHRRPLHPSASVSIRQHPSASVSIYVSIYVSIHQHIRQDTFAYTSAYTSGYVRIRQDTSGCVRIRHTCAWSLGSKKATAELDSSASPSPHSSPTALSNTASTTDCIRQHTSAYVSIRQHTL
jgi:hypothetical protein